MSDDDLDLVIIAGIALLVLYGLYKAGTFVNSAVQSVESYL